MTKARFTKAEIQRLIRAARDEGVRVDGIAVVLPAGTEDVRIETVPDASDIDDKGPNPPHGGPMDWE